MFEDQDNTIKELVPKSRRIKKLKRVRDAANLNRKETRQTSRSNRKESKESCRRLPVTDASFLSKLRSRCNRLTTYSLALSLISITPLWWLGSVLNQSILLLPGFVDKNLLIPFCYSGNFEQSLYDSSLFQRQCSLYARNLSCKLFKYAIESLGFQDDWKRIKTRYKKIRCHLRMRDIYLPKWHKVFIEDFSFHSTDDTCDFISISKQPNQGLLRTQVGMTKNPPPPIIEIHDLSFDWRSWTRPVIDINASGVVIHLVAGMMNDNLHGPIQGLQGQMNFPSISLGNSSIAEVLSFIPPPPTKEGLYPRMGIVNITNVNITVYGYPNSDFGKYNEDFTRQLTRMWSMNIPDEVFVPLLYATQDAGPQGTDQMLISSVIIKSFGIGFWNHILKAEQKRVNSMMYKTIEAFENWFIAVRQKINEGTQVIALALEQGLEQIVNDESNPFRQVLFDWKQKWDDLFIHVEEGKKFIEHSLVLNDWVDIIGTFGRNISEFIQAIQNKT